MLGNSAIFREGENGNVCLIYYNLQVILRQGSQFWNLIRTCLPDRYCLHQDESAEQSNHKSPPAPSFLLCRNTMPCAKRNQMRRKKILLKTYRKSCLRRYLDFALRTALYCDKAGSWALADRKST